MKRLTLIIMLALCLLFVGCSSVLSSIDIGTQPPTVTNNFVGSWGQINSNGVVTTLDVFNTDMTCKVNLTSGIWNATYSYDEYFLTIHYTLGNIVTGYSFGSDNNTLLLTSGATFLVRVAP